MKNRWIIEYNTKTMHHFIIVTASTEAEAIVVGINKMPEEDRKEAYGITISSFGD